MVTMEADESRKREVYKILYPKPATGSCTALPTAFHAASTSNTGRQLPTIT